MNNSSIIRTPYHQMPITWSLRSIDRKVWRDQYCLECGQPFIAISDKFVSIIDAAFPIQMARSGDKLIEARCGRHTCKQYYRLFV